MAKPLLLVDIDGVLNPSPSRADRELFEEVEVGSPEPFTRALVNVQHGDWLRELTHHFSLLWASTWQEDAAYSFGPLLGLPDLPYIDFDSSPLVAGLMLKIPAVAEATKGRAFVWFDDEVGPREQAWFDNAPTLCVAVDPRRGLERGHVDDAIAFATSLPEAER